MPEPRDKKLYGEIKKKVYKKIPKHSAYRSGILVKNYKKAYKKKHGNDNSYIGKKTKKKGIGRWFREKWVNQDGKVGYHSKSDIYRPSKRITRKTPTTHKEISKRELKRARSEKYRKGRVKKFKRKTKKRRQRKNKKTRKKKQKGGEANICQMLSDPDEEVKQYVRTLAIGRAKSRMKRTGIPLPEGRRVGLRLAYAEADNYCQKMNNWDDNYKCNRREGNCAKIKDPAVKKARNDMLRRRGFKL